MFFSYHAAESIKKNRRYMENGNEVSIEMLKQDCRHVLENALHGLRSQRSLTKPIPELSIAFSKDFSLKARVGWLTRDCKSVLITISDGFLRDLYNNVTRHASLIAAAMDANEADNDAMLIYEAVYDWSIQFVLHHELFHLLCGHLDLASAMSSPADVVDESYNLSENQADIEKNDLHYYFLEMEADSSAIVWLAHKLIMGSVNNLLIHRNLANEPISEAATELVGPAKISAYRTLFMAIWLVISLMERDRIGGDKKNESHPLPSARIIAAIHTLIESYSSLVVTRMERGRTYAKLDDQHIVEIAEFQKMVAGPFCAFFSGFPDAADQDRELKDISDFDMDNPALEIVKDACSLLSGDEANSAGGRQLDIIETIREIKLSELKLYRYFEETIL